MTDEKNPRGAREASATSAVGAYGNMPELTEKQRRVLDAAMEVFAEKGYAAASTSEIAKRAGVAEGTVFKTYRTKKDLLIGVVGPFFARNIAPLILTEVRAILRAPHASVVDFLRAIYVDRLAFMKTHERLVRIAFQEVPFHEEIRAIARQTAMETVYPDALALVTRFQAEGKIRAGNPASILRLVIGTLFTYAIARILVAPEIEWDDDAEVELMVQVLAQGLKPPG